MVTLERKEINEKCKIYAKNTIKTKSEPRMNQILTVYKKKFLSNQIMKLEDETVITIVKLYVRKDGSIVLFGKDAENNSVCTLVEEEKLERAIVKMLVAIKST